jgi:hypothetical protein
MAVLGHFHDAGDRIQLEGLAVVVELLPSFRMELLEPFVARLIVLCTLHRQRRQADESSGEKVACHRSPFIERLRALV